MQHSFSDEDLKCAAHLVGYSGNVRQFFESIQDTDFSGMRVADVMGSARNNMRSNKTRRIANNQRSSIMAGGGHDEPWNDPRWNDPRWRRAHQARRRTNGQRRFNDETKHMKLYILIVLLIAAIAKAFGRA